MTPERTYFPCDPSRVRLSPPLAMRRRQLNLEVTVTEEWCQLTTILVVNCSYNRGYSAIAAVFIKMATT